MKMTCDIFCNVIDNYGDVGVCWRLARQLCHEYGLSVRLWLDDLAALARLCPEANVLQERQFCRGVEVYHWGKPFPEAEPADVVIEAFACDLPESYLGAMAVRSPSPAWVNLEYLSAEDWVEGCHKLPSPHPTLPLTTYFYFPGFTRRTGGLILEHDVFQRRDAFQRDEARQGEFWRSMDLEPPAASTLTVSLFCYDNAALDSLLDAWSGGSEELLCLVPEGPILPRVGRYFRDAAPSAGKVYCRGSLKLRILPFVEQERYDLLLWACDMNFVRGEDSFVRAQWAGRPFAWQIYPQQDAVHLKKLGAFLMLFGGYLTPSARQAVTDFWLAWNAGGEAGQAWPAFRAEYDGVNECAQKWSKQLAANNLAMNLLDFCREIGRMRAVKN
jgi:uncharacterized repeat protein (TIGR03837 family)